MPVRTRFLPAITAVFLLTAQLGAASGAQVPVTPEQRAQYQAAMQRLDSAMALIDQTKSTIDLSQLDPVALVARLDADPDRIVAFVRSRIAFQPYPGMLRGVAGTLMTRAGNALDQSLLLAALLHDAGFEARINYMPLNDTQSRQVLAEAGRPAMPPLPPVNIAALNALSQANPANIDPALKTRIRQAMQPPAKTGQPAPVMAAWLEKSLGEAGVTLDSKAVLNRLPEWSKDYFWVEYRTDPWAKWHSVQPLFAKAKDDLADPEAKQRFSNEVPDKWLWQLHLQLTIETKRGEELDTTSLFDWTRPVANLNGKPLSITVSPTNLSSRTAFKNLKQTLAQAQLFSASFNGAQTGDLFDLNGNTINPDVLSGGGFGAAGLFMTMNKKGQAASGALAALGGSASKPGQKPLPVQVLTGVWIDLTVIPPDGFGDSRHQRRYLLDRIGAAQRQAEKVTRLVAMTPEDIARRLAAGYTFVVSGGRPAPGLMISRHLKRLAGQRSLLAYVSALRYLKHDDGAKLADFLVNSSPVSLFQLGLLRDSVGPDVYRPAPGIIAIETGFGAKLERFQDKWTRLSGSKTRQNKDLEPGFESTKTEKDLASTVRMDVIFNPATALDITNAAKTNPGIIAGVTMTRLETGRIAAPGKDEQRTSAYAILSAARKSGTALKVIKPADSDEGWKQRVAALAAFDFPEASRDAMLRDLRNGYVIAIPQTGFSSAERPSHVAWWRVMPATGNTLGMMDDGRGSELVEYLTSEEAALDTLSAVGDIYSTETTLAKVWGCISASNPSCCLSSVMGNYVLGLGTGSLVSGMGKALDASLQTAMLGAVMSLAGVSPSVGGSCK